MSPTDAKVVRDWLKAIGLLCGGNAPVEEVRARIDAATSMLRNDFAAAAFCPASVAHVARQFTFFPSYGQIHAALTAWCNENSARSATGETKRSEQQIIDDSWVDFAGARLGEGAARGHILSLVRTHASPAAVRTIMERHYRTELYEIDEEIAEREHDRGRAAAEVARAPNLKHIAYAQGRSGSVTSLPPEPAPPRPHYLTGAALEASRRAAGIPHVPEPA